MKGVHKKFDRSLYAEHDGRAKEAMRVHLESCGHTVTVPPENYGVDLRSSLGGLTMYHEVEISRGWMGIDPFPWSKGSIPERKYRLVRMLKGNPLFFWMLSDDLSRAVVFSAGHLKKRFLIEVPNRLVKCGEYFYRIPLRLGKQFKLLRGNKDYGQNDNG